MSTSLLHAVASLILVAGILDLRTFIIIAISLIDIGVRTVRRVAETRRPCDGSVDCGPDVASA
jgi:hypothetical protein